MRVALYLRYSTELQNPLSPRDQEHACRLYAQRQPNWQIVDVFGDAAVSGRDNKRPGLDQLERALEAGSVDIVLVYHLTRLSRRRSVATAFIQRLHVRSTKFYTTKEGEITPILVGALSIAAQMQAEAAGSDSKRGQSAKRRDHKLDRQSALRLPAGRCHRWHQEARDPARGGGDRGAHLHGVCGWHVTRGHRGQAQRRGRPRTKRPTVAEHDNPRSARP